MSGLAKFFQAPSDADTPEDAKPYARSLIDNASNIPDEVDHSVPMDANQVWREDLQRRQHDTICFFGKRMTVHDEEPGVPPAPASEAFIDATNLSQLNLQTRSLQLDLCRVERFWKWRRTKRGKKYPIFPQHLQDDGMLSVLYSGGVVSAELLVYDTAEPSTTREHAQRLHNIQDYKRLHVFFYSAYAVHMAASLLNVTKDSSAGVFLSLTGIPALCIVPYEPQGCLYWRQETCPFSVCIGDSSLMDAEEPKRTLRFDESDDLRIQVLQVRHEIMDCFQIEPHDTEGAVLRQLDDCSLKETYIAHILGNREVDKGIDKEDTTATADVVIERRKRSAPASPQDAKHGDNKRSRVLPEGSKRLVDVGDLHKNWHRGEIDICAVVLSFTQPWRTKRGDWTMTLSLIDDTLPIIEDLVESVNVVLFVKERDFHMLPKILKGGDVVVLQGLTIQTYRHEIQLQGAGRGRNSKRYEAFRDNDGDNNNDRVGMLWRWGQKRFLQHATMKQSHKFSIADMLPQENRQTEWYGNEKAAQHGDITVVVTAILMVPENMEAPKPQCFLRVWDGTGPPTSDNWPLDTPEAEESVQSGDPPQVVVTKIAEFIQKLRAGDEFSDLTAPKQLTGRVANVSFWENQHAELVRNGTILVGSLIRLRNVNDGVYNPTSNFRCLHMGPKSSCTPLPIMTREFVMMLENHQVRLQRKDAMNPTSAVLPLTPDEQPPPTPKRPVAELVARSGFILNSLREFIVAHPSVDFEGVVRIAGTVPNLSALSANNITSVCPMRKGRFFYQFALRLEQDDSPIVLDTLVPDAEPSSMKVGQLLFGIPASEASHNAEQAVEHAKAIEKERAQWHAKIRCRIHNGQKFFIVTSLKKKSNWNSE